MSTSNSFNEMWKALDIEVTSLHARWLVYRQLYGTSESVIDILNNSASTFFFLLNDTLLRDIQLSLCMLGDPAESGIGKNKKENLSLWAIQKEIKVHDLQPASDVCRHITLYEDSIKGIRKSRNRWIAHYDRDTILKKKVEPLMHASRSEIETALCALRNVMNCISEQCLQVKQGYEYTSLNEDGETLIHVLKYGLRYKELINSGIVDIQDAIDLLHQNTPPRI